MAQMLYPTSVNSRFYQRSCKTSAIRRQPTEQDENKNVSREAAAADAIAVAASRLGNSDMPFLRADARSYVLPSLRDSRVFKFKEREGIATTLEFLADASV